MTKNEKEFAIHEDDKELAAVPFYAFDCIQRHYRQIFKMLVILVILSITLCFASNVAWLIYESQFDYEDKEVTVEANDSGNANYVGQDGDINNGMYQSEDEK